MRALSVEAAIIMLDIFWLNLGVGSALRDGGYRF